MDVLFTPDEYDAWHTAEMDSRGIPHPGRNALSGEIDVDAEWTLAWTVPSDKVTVGKETFLVVNVPDPTGLRVAEVSRSVDQPVTVTVDGKVALAEAADPAETVYREKPAEITIDGTTYRRKAIGGELQPAPDLG